MNKYECIVCGFVYDEAVGCRTKALGLGQNGRISRLTGRVPTAARPRKISKWSKFKGGVA